jgi:hypothetical protein
MMLIITRFLQAAMISRADTYTSKSLMDKFCAWAFETLGGGKHGDLMRVLAGAKSAANQIEYVKKYGSSKPAIVDEEGFPAVTEDEPVAELVGGATSATATADVDDAPADEKKVEVEAKME